MSGSLDPKIGPRRQSLDEVASHNSQTSCCSAKLSKLLKTPPHFADEFGGKPQLEVLLLGPILQNAIKHLAILGL